MNHHNRHTEHGQSMALVAVLLVALIGMLALSLDGGNAYLQRRGAQNAADSSALAGAREVCLGKTDGEVRATAQNYAGRNGVPEPLIDNVDVLVVGGLVTVTTAIPFPTWFAGVLGRPNLTAGGLAAAGCFAPTGGTGVLPVAWSCQPPVDGEPITDTCEVQYGNTYIVMDDEKTGTDVFCQDPPNSGLPAGYLDCDFNNDTFDDVIAGGDRSWLNLNGGSNSADELGDWVEGGFPGEINYHTWLEGNTGTANSVFQAARDRVGDDVIVPVFDMYCDNSGDPQVTCPGLYHGVGDPVPDTTIAGSGTGFYYHIISFSIFHITCVDAPPGVLREDGDTSKNYCDGKKAAGDAGFYDPPYNEKTIEGYFKEGYVPGFSGSGGGVYAGVWVLSLIR